jgi:signal transduction histidine kinase
MQALDKTMRLLGFITANMNSILDEWESFAREIEPARDMTREELRDHAKQMLETIVQDLNTTQNDEEQKEKSKGHGLPLGHEDDMESAPEKHASVRAQAGFNIEEMISEYRALRASVLRLWRKSCKSAGKFDLDDMTRFNEAIDQAVAESVARYSSEVKRAQDLFLGILGHDLRNPLGAIIMSARFLIQDVTLSGKHIKAASIIHNSGMTMSQLINDLLDFARTRLGQSLPISPSATNLADIVEHTVTEIRAFHPDRMIIGEVNGDVKGTWDQARIAEVFSNLVGNAIKYGAASDPVSIILSEQQGDPVIATVHNTGNPIPEGEIPYIFDPMRRPAAASADSGKGSGLGRGLYIAREIIKAHGGTIDVVSSAENGTRFTVRIPRQCRSV